jgi:hypothetical protein
LPEVEAIVEAAKCIRAIVPKKEEKPQDEALVMAE